MNRAGIIGVGIAVVLMAIAAGSLTLSGRPGTAQAETAGVNGFYLGFYTIAGSDAPNLACGARTTQTGTNVTATIDCTSATGGLLSGTVDPTVSPPGFSGTIIFGPPFNYTVAFSGIVANDGSAGNGTWSCTPDCSSGSYAFSRIAPSTPECAAVPAGPPTEVTLTSSSGDQLIIPAGSVNDGLSATQICAQFVNLPVGVGPGSRILSRAYRLTPSGTTFDPPATGVYHYSDDEIVPGMDETNLMVAVYDSVDGRWEALTGTIDTENNTITVYPIEHFSIFSAGFDCGTGPDTDSALGDPDGIPDLCDLDDDDDGCSDDTEAGSNAATGGQRNPLDPWDFYDVLGPGQALPKDGQVDLANDILGVIQHYSPTGAAPYDVNFDRGPSAGPNTWNMTAPDGVIDLANDILGVILQYLHDCS